MRPLKVEARSARALTDVDVGRRVLLGGGDGAHQRAVVELAVEVDVQGLRRGVVDPGDVVPGVGLQRRGAVAEHLAAGALVSLKPIVRGPVSMVVSSWKPTWPPSRLDTIAASSAGNALELIQALTVMLPVNCRAVGLPRLT